jgi:hypothetical protein
VSQHTYLIRYGAMGHVGRFPALPECDTPFQRGERVVIQSDRGLELGEVLISLDGTSAASDSPTTEPPGRSGTIEASPAGLSERPRVLRMAGPEDLVRSRHAESSRSDRFALCERVLRDEAWPWALIDVEPLLDGRSAVIHYLGPAQIDGAALRARFRVACDLDVVLEPVGSDPDSELLAAMAGEVADRDDGGCATCGCGETGGCGAAAALRRAAAKPAAGAEASGEMHAPHAGCASCGISKLLAARKRVTA